MSRVVYREIGGTRRRSSKKSPSRKALSRKATPAGGSGFGQLLAQLFSASGALQRSRRRIRR